jgi:hypothetical protein
MRHRDAPPTNETLEALWGRVDAAQRFDVARLGGVIQDLLEALTKSAKAAKTAKYTELDALQLSKVQAQLMKAVDEAARLAMVVQGMGPTVQETTWLALLSDAEVQELTRRAGAARGAVTGA